MLNVTFIFQVQESHIWFNKAVARWLDIALYKAMQRIIKVIFTALKICFKLNNTIFFDYHTNNQQAVELDDLSPVDDLVKHSSSAVDIRTVLMQVCSQMYLH